MKSDTFYYNKYWPDFPMFSISFHSLDIERSVLVEIETISKEVTLIKVNVPCHL